MVTAIDHVMRPPAATGFGVAVFTSVICALGSTVVVTEHALGSTVTPEPAVPTQVFVIGPVVDGALPVMTILLVPTATEEAVHVTV